MEKSDAAVAEIRRALDVKGENAELLAYLAALYRQREEYRDAVRVLERVVELTPDNDEHVFNLGAAYDQVKDKPNAVRMMERAIELNPENAAALNYLGYTYAEMGERLDEAEDLIRRALAIEPHDGFYIDSLGWVYYQRGQYDKAVEQLERAVEQAGQDATISEHLGDAYEKAGNVGGAIRAYKEAWRGAEEREQIDRIKSKLRALGAETRTSGAEL
jgi:Flp pilus assembly protein TadD